MFISQNDHSTWPRGCVAVPSLIQASRTASSALVTPQYTMASYENNLDLLACQTQPEHSTCTATSDTNPVERKYRRMKAAGGAAAWYSIPVVGGPVLPMRQLMALEDMEIGLRPNSWNEAGKKYQNKLKLSRPHREKTAPSAT